jgi:hypothetical protein
VLDVRFSPADSPEATDIAEAARLLIDTWFYPLSTEMHVRLAEMYIADPRFTATYENMAEGMAQYVHDAIVANARYRDPSLRHVQGRGAGRPAPFRAIRTSYRDPGPSPVRRGIGLVATAGLQLVPGRQPGAGAGSGGPPGLA